MVPGDPLFELEGALSSADEAPGAVIQFCRGTLSKSPEETLAVLRRTVELLEAIEVLRASWKAKQPYHALPAPASFKA